MQRILIFALLLCIQSHAIFLAGGIGDSRLQSENEIYRPSGIVGLSLETGFFNEPENIVDYKMSFVLKRFGYSHHDGDNSVSLWSFGIKPITWSVTLYNITFEIYGSFNYIFTASGITDKFENDRLYRETKAYSYTYGYGYRLGYSINSQFFVALQMDMQYLDWISNPVKTNVFIGGLGLSFQWNLPI